MELPSDDNLTPAMRQFKAAKEQYPDAVIFFRMGDFYETFYDDAKITAKELEITLTKRGSKAKIPLAGIPYHALDNYLPKLVKKGYKVAICEQLENPKLAKGVVKRGIIRVVTPGTLTDSIDDKSNNFIMSVTQEKDKYGVAIADISTGDFFSSELNNIEQAINEIARYNPTELILDFQPNKELKILIDSKKIFWEQKYPYSYRKSYELLTSHFNTLSLDGFGIENLDLAIIASGTLLNYIIDTQKTDIKNIRQIKAFSPEKFMILDQSTLRNLEISNNIIDNSTKNTLLEAIDSTVTSMGSRLLKQWIKRPLIDIKEIEQRSSSVEILKDNTLARSELIEAMNDIYDIERLITKITYKTANPRDLIALRNSLKQIPILKQILSTLDKNELLDDISNINSMEDLILLISGAIKDEPPLSVREGGFIKQGFNSALDELHNIKSGGKDWIIKLEQQEKEKLGINLRIGFNKVFGYYIEVTKRNLDSVPDYYIRKQTTANAERFIMPELKEKEELILGAEEKINTMEFDIFSKILDEIGNKTGLLQEISRKIAILDILNGFSSVAYVHNYCRAEVTEEYNMNIVDGRHAVIEQKQHSFIPNDTNFNFDSRVKIITGPNMAGKSTYMRQVAAISLLAQIGSFVPASSAKLGIVDRIFTRVGAYDNLVMGQSTFMVEMNETANILNNATSKSLIILDEIGRGTSTFDGVSIAWSVVEFITQRIKAKCLFATHYHALNKLSKEYPEVHNYNIAVKERKDDIIFLRKIVEGGTDKSYGIQVAKLAGIPNEVISRSKEIMSGFVETDDMKKKLNSSDMEQLNLYDALR